MFKGIRPFDWLMFLIETAVLLLIAYEVWTGAQQRRREQQRQVRINGFIAELGPLMDKGLRLRSTVPDPSIMNPQIYQPWLVSVAKWVEETKAFLATHSEAAAETFALVTDSKSVDTTIHAGGRIFFVIDPVKDPYQRLVVHLANLRRIIDKPEAYFLEPGNQRERR